MARTLDARPRDSVRRDSWPRWWTLVAISAVVTGVGLLGTYHIEPEAGQRSVDALAFAIVAIGGLSLLLLRRWPLAVLAIVTAGLALYIIRDYPGGPAYLAGPVAFFAFAAASERRVAYTGVAMAAVVLIAVRVVVQGDAGVEDLVLLGWSAAAVLAADAMRGRRERAAADLERQRFAEDHREEETRRRIAEDRLQIARDLHDSVAHSMATINVQSGVAAHVIDRQPGEAAAALEAIRMASRDVLAELAAMLGVLREEQPAHRQPIPDLTSLDDLVDSSRLAGMVVDVRTAGDVGAVSPPVSTAAYRIVQEALTNVVRHARTDAATVTVTSHADGHLDLEVIDRGTGNATTSNGSGMGLVGIEERAVITGGRCEIGPRAGGGFRVAVSWPARR